MISFVNIQVLVADPLLHFTTHITTSKAQSIYTRSYMIFYTAQKRYNQMFHKLMQINKHSNTQYRKARQLKLTVQMQLYRHSTYLMLC